MGTMPLGRLALPEEGDKTLLKGMKKVRLTAVRIFLGFPTDKMSPALRMNVLAARKSVLPALRKRPDQVLDAIGSPDVLPGLLTLGSGFETPRRFCGSSPSLMVDLSHRRKFGVLEEPIILSMVSSGSRTVEAGVLCNLSRRQRRCWLTRVGFPLPSRNPRGKSRLSGRTEGTRGGGGLKPNKASLSAQERTSPVVSFPSGLQSSLDGGSTPRQGGE